MSDRKALFISHANPEDNLFVLWLGTKLAALGYEVWADILKLHGGDDWQRKLEAAIRERTAKVLFVATPEAVEKQGVRNELQLSSDVGKKTGDKEFIIPLVLRKCDIPFLIIHAQRINFVASWSKGLKTLLRDLAAYNLIPSCADASGMWREIQLLHAKTTSDEPEELISNWLPIGKMPAAMHRYHFNAGLSNEDAAALLGTSPWPVAKYKDGFLSFATTSSLKEHFGTCLRDRPQEQLATDIFVNSGWLNQGIRSMEASNIITGFARQAIERYVKERGLSRFELANGRMVWWGSTKAVPATRISFQWPSVRGSRKIQGFSKKRNLYWHCGLSFFPQLRPVPHIRLIQGVVFSDDGFSAIVDARRAHRLRRSFAKGWRNPRWRDMLLAFVHWLSNGSDRIELPVGADTPLCLDVPPLTFLAPVSVMSEDLVDDDEDDDEPSLEMFDDDDEGEGLA